MARDRKVYHETYNGMSLKAKSDLPTLRHIATDSQKKFTVIGCDIRAAGIIERDGERLEYQDLRVYLKVEPK
jgi:hypothetical protein